MDSISIETEQETLLVARNIKEIIEISNNRFGSWYSVSGDKEVRECVSYLNKLCESKLPKKIEARRDAADVIIAGINPSDIWDGTLGGALKPAIAPFKALFYAAIGNIFGAASSVLEIRNQITSHQENGDSTNRKASPEVMETQFIQLFYDITFIDRKTILLEYRPAIEYCTSMTPLSVNLRGRIKKSRDII